MKNQAVPANDLNGLQQWLQTAITTPGPTDESELSQIVRQGPGNLNVTQRLGIYAHAYLGRLVECLECEFPVLRLALGEPLFARFASEYLTACPSESYTLTDLGRRFPDYLRATRPEDDELWPDFIIDLATLERLFSEVYHEQGPEDGTDPIPTDTVRIVREPGTRWLKCRFPVDEYFTASRHYLADKDDMPVPDFPQPEPVVLLIFRRQYVVQLRRVASDQVPDS